MAGVLRVAGGRYNVGAVAMTQERYVAGMATFLDPKDHAPPLGAKVLLLTTTGTCVIGTWSSDGGFLAWHPLPKVPPHIKEKHL